MNTVLEETTLTTADLAAVAEMPAAQREVSRDLKIPAADKINPSHGMKDEQLVPLFLAEVANDFRSRWDAVQSSFVDDPKQAVRHGDELVVQVMKSLAETFSNERTKLEGQLDQTDNASTENLRVALRRYRSFFQRLLSL
jgi:hypothetical protein